jgi:hypothetical protein
VTETAVLDTTVQLYREPVSRGVVRMYLCHFMPSWCKMALVMYKRYMHNRYASHTRNVVLYMKVDVDRIPLGYCDCAEKKASAAAAWHDSAFSSHNPRTAAQRRAMLLFAVPSVHDTVQWHSVPTSAPCSDMESPRKIALLTGTASYDAN